MAANNSIPRVCSVEGCVRPRFGRGWCRLHYQRWKKHGDPFFTPAKIILTPGRRFTRWTVLGGPTPVRGRSHYRCRCDCGAERLVNLSYLLNGVSRSCGCLLRDLTISRCTTHGESKRTRLYVIWQAVLGRCYSPGHASYQNYGGRGIRVCRPWRESYTAFRDWALAHGYRADLSIDRIDNDGPYSPANCRWTGRTTQANNRRNNRILRAWGESRTLAQWARDPRCAVPGGALEKRLELGWPAERAISEPSAKRPARHITAFGETKTLAAWARDPRCLVTRRVLARRLNAGQDPTEAMSAVTSDHPQ